MCIKKKENANIHDLHILLHHGQYSEGKDFILRALTSLILFLENKRVKVHFEGAEEITHYANPLYTNDNKTAFVEKSINLQS